MKDGRVADAPPGQVARRRFPHEEAVARYDAGETIGRLAREYGVSWTAVGRVVDAKRRKRMHAQAVANLERRRTGCRGGCGVLVWTHIRGHSGYCSTCAGEKRREANGPNHGTESEYKAGCRCGDCLRAASDAKRQRRLKTRVACSHGCGTLVDSINRRNPDKPPECRQCSHRRVLADQRAKKTSASR